MNCYDRLFLDMKYKKNCMTNITRADFLCLLDTKSWIISVELYLQIVVEGSFQLSIGPACPAINTRSVCKV